MWHAWNKPRESGKKTLNARYKTEKNCLKPLKDKTRLNDVLKRGPYLKENTSPLQTYFNIITKNACSILRKN